MEASTPHKARKWLKVELFPGIYQRYPLDNPLNIGRAEYNDVVLNDISVSQQHAVIGPENDSAWVEDLGSTNGTLVGDKIVRDKEYVQENELIGVGYVNMLVQSEIEPQVLTGRPEPDELEKLLQCDHLALDVVAEEATVSELCRLLAVELATTKLSRNAQNRFIASVRESLANACQHGCQGLADKSLRWQLLSNNLEIRCIVTDPGPGFNYYERLRNIVTQEQPEPKRGLALLLDGADAVEYNSSGNQVVLIKFLASPTLVSPHLAKESKQPAALGKPMSNATDFTPSGTLLIKPSGQPLLKKTQTSHKHLIVRYPQRMVLQRPGLFELVIADEKLHQFPEEVPLRSTVTIDGCGQDLWHLVPACPGCLCSPPFREIDMSQLPVQVDFWLTPLAKGQNESSCLQFIKKGHLAHSCHFAYQLKSDRSMLSWRLALLTPLLLVVLDWLRLFGQGNPAATLDELGLLFSKSGILTIIGLLLGLIFLANGLIARWRLCQHKSQILQEQIAFEEVGNSNRYSGNNA